MTDDHYGDHYRRGDDGNVLNAALGAVILVLAGLSLMVWQEYQDARDGAVTVSILQRQ